MKVLGTDGAAKTAVRDDGVRTPGTRVALARGRSAKARFTLIGTDGKLEIREASGKLLSSGALPTGVAALPEFDN